VPSRESEAYCPTCREQYLIEGDNPPYSVIHISYTKHLHPITRVEVERS